MIDQLLNPYTPPANQVDNRNVGRNNAKDGAAKEGFDDALSATRNSSNKSDEGHDATEDHDAKDANVAANARNRNSADPVSVANLKAQALRDKIGINGNNEGKGADKTGAMPRSKLSEHDSLELLKANKLNDKKDVRADMDEASIAQLLQSDDGTLMAQIAASLQSMDTSDASLIAAAANGEFQVGKERGSAIGSKSDDLDINLDKLPKTADLDNDSENSSSDEESIFRFTSAKNVNRTLDIATRSVDGRVDFEVKDAGNKLTDNVMVLDSRRFLGLAPNSNASSLVGLIASDGDWVSAMQKSSGLADTHGEATTKLVHTLKLQMTPIELGTVTMALRMVGEELTVHMTVDNAAAYRKLQDDNRSMMDALKAQGLSVDNITISISASDKSDQAGNQSNGSSQQSMGQANDGRENDANKARSGPTDLAGGFNNDSNEASNGTSAAHDDNGVYL